MLANEVVEILFSVVVGQLVARFDGLAGHNEHAIAADDHFAVWTAGVVNVASDVFTGCSVDGAAIAKVEKVLSTNLIGFIVSNQGAEIFHHKSTAGN